MEDLKQMWQQYDEKLQQTQSFNEQLLRKINTRHSADRLAKLRSMEYIGLLVIGLLLVLMISRGGELGGLRIVQVSYGLVLAQLTGWLAWTFRKLNYLSRMDAAKLPVAEMLRRVARFRLMLMRERLWGGLCALLLLLIPANVLADYWMGGDVPLLEQPVRYVLRMLPAVGVGICAGLWAYRRYYKDPLQEITDSLREIEHLPEEPPHPQDRSDR